MKLKNKKNKIRGSATLIVIIASIIFMLYAQSTYADVSHMKSMYNSYEKDTLDRYNTEYNNKVNEISVYEEE